MMQDFIVQLRDATSAKTESRGPQFRETAAALEAKIKDETLAVALADALKAPNAKLRTT